MTERITKTELANRLDVSQPYISKLVKSGVVSVGSDGLVEWPKAKQEIESNEHPSYKGHKKVNKQAKAKAKIEQLDNLDNVALHKKYTQAKTAEKVYSAKLRELEFQKENGRLIPIEEVIEDAARTGEEIRAILLAIPSRIAPALDGKTAVEIEAAMTEAINEALTILHETRFK